MNIKSSTLASLLLSLKSFSAAKENKLGFDIYGDPSKFDADSSISVDRKTCEYHAEVKVNFVAADPVFPPIMPGPSGPGSCLLETQECNGQSCLNEVRNVFSLGKNFEKYTGFNHIGFDWSPCGHPPLEVSSILYIDV